jgi:hypothetical protein
LIEVDEGVVTPEFLDDFGASDDLTWARQEESQDAEWLRLELYANARSPQFSRPKIGFEYSEANDRSCGGILHDATPFGESLVRPAPAGPPR